MSFLREPDAEPLPGYKLVEPLGSGGYGEVWKCVAPGELYKAIKFVYGNLNSLDAEGVRAEQELKALQRIKEVRHPFVLTNERIEIVEGELVIVMELADKSLHDAFVECQAAGLVGIPRHDLLRYMRDAAEALDHMIDKHNLLHLDIKPRNLFLVSDRVKVADFGLVKHLERTSASGMLSGVTPLYAPPETINNKISPQSDQYSLAIVYQELLTGQRPFTGKNARQLAIQHLHDEPELRALPESERPIVGRALSKDPNKRWPNCLAFVRALYQAQQQAVLGAREGPAGVRSKTMADTMEDILLEEPDDEVVHEPQPRGEQDEISSVSQLGITVAQPKTGAMRPTLVVGLGHFGRRALTELRCRFLDRFGDLSKVPLIRLLYLDPDPEAVRAASSGAPELALGANAVCHLPLQPASNYRRRSLEHINEWLPREKLYALPRSLQTQGSRALGRLALSDNHVRLAARLKRELQHIIHPDALYQSVSQTGLALRENVARVYIIAAAGGGASGMLADLGYMLRGLLKQLRQGEGDIITLLQCGAPSDPTMPLQEQANIYACLTELNHFDDTAIPFFAQYNPDAPRLRDEGKAFASIYLLPMAHRSPEAMRDTIAHLGSYVFHDLTTGLGARLDKQRHAKRADNATPFRSFGTFAVWFPRGLLLRLAARSACARLIEDWESTEEPKDLEEIADACDEALKEDELSLEVIATRIEDLAKLPNEGKPTEALTGLLWQMEEQSQQSLAHESPGGWAQEALTRLREWIGAGFASEHDSSWRQSRLGRVFSAAIAQLTQEWEGRLSKVAFAQMERRGQRVAAAEVALQNLIEWCQEAAREARLQLTPETQRSQELAEQLTTAIEGCIAATGGFSLFGRVRRQLRIFMDQLAAYARQHLAEVVAHALVQFYLQLAGRLQERLQEMSFCRQRLRHLRECLEAAEDDAESLAGGRFSADVTGMSPAPTTETYWDAIRESMTARVVLPDGHTDLSLAAEHFVRRLTDAQWEQLDADLHERVLAPLGGLHHLCVSQGDLLRSMAVPLTEQTAVSLGALMPVTDVAEVEFQAAANDGNNIQDRTAGHFMRAAPLVEETDSANQQAFLLAPASDAGRSLGEQAKQIQPTLHLLRVPGQADLMFCREQGNLTPQAVQRLLRAYRAAYIQSSPTPQSSPHARFDITDWVPLEP